MKTCQTCTYFPCTKLVCNIGNKEGCEEYKSVVSKMIEEMGENDT